jgi:hypothetical protein
LFCHWVLRSHFGESLVITKGLDASASETRDALPPRLAAYEFREVARDHAFRNLLCEMYGDCKGHVADFARISHGDLVAAVAREIESGWLVVVRQFDTLGGRGGAQPVPPIPPIPPIPPVPPPIALYYDLASVTAPGHFAPGREGVKVEYDVVNSENAAVTAAKLEILRKKDDKILKKFDLPPPRYTHGRHEFEWDGTVEKGAEFPDGFATIEHSTYVARVTLSGAKGDKTGTTEIQVELKDFKVELGNKDYLKDDDSGKRSKGVLAQIGALPAASTVKLKLTSNLFAQQDAEMNNQTAYSEYEHLWAGGPRIPLIATATVIDSTGAEVRAGMAMGRARVVWDYSDPAQTKDTYKAVAYAPPVFDKATGHGSDSQGAKPYVDAARLYKKAGTLPKDGDNAHVDFGGKRTDNPGPPIFHEGDSGTKNFPFQCSKGPTRKWAGLAPFVKTGDEEARAGAVFRPSRMAGDNYAVTAYLDLAAKLDVADEKPPAPDRTVTVGSFEVWRQVDLVEHHRKNSLVTGVMPSFAEYFEDAYIEVKDDRGGIKDLTQAWYDPEMQAAIGVVTGYALLKQYALKATVSHWDGGTGAATGWIAAFETYNDFKNKVMTGQGLSNAGLTQVLINNQMETHFKYVQKTSYYAADLGAELCKKKVRLAPEGLTIMQFDCASSLEPSTWKILNGMAVFTQRSRTGFLLTNTDAGTEQTPAHEIGHCMFLPHAPRVDVDQTTGATTRVTSGGGITPSFHDAKNWNCLMSYNRPRPGFCGLCLLRLRGYDGAKFNENGPK